MKKGPEKSKNVLEEKRKKGQVKHLYKKDQHFYNNCYERCSGATKKNIKHSQQLKYTWQNAG